MVTGTAEIGSFTRKNKSDKRQTQVFRISGIQTPITLKKQINIDCSKICRAVNTLIKNRLNASRTGRKLTKAEKARYSKSLQIRYSIRTNLPGRLRTAQKTYE